MKKAKYDGNLEGLTKIDIDDKTIVYARPHRNTEAVKRQYLKLIKSNGSPTKKMHDIVIVSLPAE